MVNVNKAEADKNGEKYKAVNQLNGKSEPQKGKQIKRSAQQLNHRVAGGNPAFAVTAFSAEENPAYHGNQVPVLNLRSAGCAMGTTPDKGFVTGRAVDYNIEKASDYRAENEHENGKNNCVGKKNLISHFIMLL